jgi:HPt (histidine-containing phosphotransfer) domain-containing protein
MADGLEALVPAGVEDLLPTFFENRRKELNTLRAAVATHDFATVLHIAHRMKGVGEPYGFPTISLIGVDLDGAVERADMRRLLELVKQYVDYLNSVRISASS